MQVFNIMKVPEPLVCCMDGFVLCRWSGAKLPVTCLSMHRPSPFSKSALVLQVLGYPLVWRTGPALYASERDLMSLTQLVLDVRQAPAINLACSVCPTTEPACPCRC